MRPALHTIAISGLRAVAAGEKNVFSPNMLIGCTVFLVGLAVYSHYKLRSVQQKVAQQLKSAGADEEKLIEAVPLTNGDERSASLRRDVS